MVVDRYTRPLDVGEPNCGDVRIERLGYVSPQRQIEALMYAGGKLMKPLDSEYDYETLEDCIQDNANVGPVRDADLIDIGRLSASLAEESQRRGTGSVLGSDDSAAVKTDVAQPEKAE